MEIFDLYDEFGNLINKTAFRGTKLMNGEFYLVVHIWIRNSNGLYLVQKRNKASDKYPNMWAITSGAAQAGDNSVDAAIRETSEEIGISLLKSDLKLLKRYFIEDDFASYITDLYIVERDILLKDLKLDILEVSECTYLSISEIKEMISKNEFWNYEHLLKRVGYFDLIEKS